MILYGIEFSLADRFSGDELRAEDEFLLVEPADAKQPGVCAKPVAEFATASDLFATGPAMAKGFVCYQRSLLFAAQILKGIAAKQAVVLLSECFPGCE